jgi:hypothetical protein
LSSGEYRVTPRGSIEQIYGEIMTSNNNLSSAEQTYAGFLSMLKIGTILTAIVAILVVILIS